MQDRVSQAKPELGSLWRQTLKDFSRWGGSAASTLTRPEGTAAVVAAAARGRKRGPEVLRLELTMPEAA